MEEQKSITNSDGNGMQKNHQMIFSETEKMTTIFLANQLEEGKDEETTEMEEFEERCSELWNQIKDAMVLGGGDLSDLIIAKFQSRMDLLADKISQIEHIESRGSTNAQLRFTCAQTALEELIKKKEKITEEEASGGGDLPKVLLIAQFRKWLQNQEAELARIRQRIPRSKNNLASLQELEYEQKAQQEQIQRKGRAKHQQLSSSQRCFGKHPPSALDREDRLCETLEQRYLALWLASLESLELISHFKARYAKNYPEENLLVSESEEGPDPKRRKTSTYGEESFEIQAMAEAMKMPLSIEKPVKLEAIKSKEGGRKVGQEMEANLLGSDIGYSSGENNSIHEGTTNTNSMEGNQQQREHDEELILDEHQKYSEEEEGQEPLWAEQIAQSSELEKSFYRTVPLDEFGMTDLDTDEGGAFIIGKCTRNSYLTEKFMDEMGKCGSGENRPGLSDSLIVHVDSPDTRQLNDFAEVMDLLDQNQSEYQINRPPYPCLSEDDCESLSTESAAERRLANRKRALTMMKTPLTAYDNKNSGERRKKPAVNGGSGGRRKWAAVRKSRSSNDGWNRVEASNGYCGDEERAMNGRNVGGRNLLLSSDFEWDEEFGTGIGGGRSNRKWGREQHDALETDELPNLNGQTEEKQPFLIARKKALCAFRDGLRQTAADSGNVSVQIQQIMELVDKSLGGVDSAAFLMSELNSTFIALSGLCQSLESKILRFGRAHNCDEGCGNNKRENEKENTIMGGIPNDQIKDLQSELMLCHERMNALETTCNNLALLLGTHLTEGSGNCQFVGKVHDDADRADYLAQFAAECTRIMDELQTLKSRFGDKFVFCSIQLPNLTSPLHKNNENDSEPSIVRGCSAQTQTILPVNHLARPSSNRREASSFWHSYLLLCLLGFFASLGTLFYTSSQEYTDWRWSFGPQLHYENGPPPI